jgi:hypothetical protein
MRNRAGAIGEEGQGDEDAHADEGGDADQRMEQEADRQIERHPRQIEEGRGAGAGQEGADLVEVA